MPVVEVMRLVDELVAVGRGATNGPDSGSEPEVGPPAAPKEMLPAADALGDQAAAGINLPSRGTISVPIAPASGTVPPKGENVTPRAPAPPVDLGEPGDEPTVNGVRKARLTAPQYDVVRALLAAGSGGLSKDSLANGSNHGDAHRILSALPIPILTGIR